VEGEGVDPVSEKEAVEVGAYEVGLVGQAKEDRSTLEGVEVVAANLEVAVDLILVMACTCKADDKLANLH
jgi:hypothetical protein